MLRHQFVRAALWVVAAGLLIPARLAAAELLDDASLASRSTPELIRLVDETDYDDPFEAHHRLAIRAVDELLRRGLPGKQKGAAHYRLAVYRLRTNSLDAALREIDAALECSPDEPEYLLMKGSLLFDSGNAADGKTYARRALVSDPDLLDAQQSYTLLAGRSAPTNEDRVLLKKSEPLLPMLVHPYLKGASTFYKADDCRAGLARLEEYLKAVPFDFQRSDDAYVLYVAAFARLAADEGNSQVAAQELVRRAVMARNLAASRAHRDEILKSLMRAVHFAYATTSPGTVLALSEAVLGDDGIEAREMAAARYVRAKAFAGLGRYSEAVEEAALAIQAEPDNLDARALKVEYLTWCGRYADALKESDQVLAKSPDHISSLLLRAQILTGCPDTKFRDADAAVALATKACEATRSGQPGEQFHPFKMLVLASAEAGDFKSAGEAVRQMRFAAGSVEEVKAVERLSDHLRDHQPWKLELRADNSKQNPARLLYRQLMLSQPNLQLPDLQRVYEKWCDELLASGGLSDAERTNCLRRRALCRYWQGKHDTATTDMESVLTARPADFSMYVLLHRVALDRNDEQAAADVMERLKRVANDTREYRWARDIMQIENDLYRFEHGTFQSPGERNQLAVQTGEQIDRLVRQEPQQPVLYQYRATNRLQRGDYEAALADSRKCLDLAAYRPRAEFADLVYEHALILEKLYRPDLALQFAAMNMHIEGSTDRARRLVSRVYRAAGKRQLAGLWEIESSAPTVRPAVAESNR